MIHITCRLTGISPGTLRSVIEYGYLFITQVKHRLNWVDRLKKSKL